MSYPEINSIIIKPEDCTVQNSTINVGYWRAPDSGTLVGAYVMDSTAVSKNNTDYLTITVYNTGAAGAGTTVMASGNSAGSSGNWVAAGVPTALTLSTTESYLKFSAGDIIKIYKTEAGSGKDFTEATFELTYIFGQG